MTESRRSGGVEQQKELSVPFDKRSYLPKTHVRRASLRIP